MADDARELLRFAAVAAAAKRFAALAALAAGGVGPGIGVYCQVVYERPKPKGTTGAPV